MSKGGAWPVASAAPRCSSEQEMLRADYAYLSSTYVDKDQYEGQYLSGAVG